MTLDDSNRRELERILSLLATDDFDEAVRGRLSELISQSSEAQQIYLDHCQIHAMLRESAGLLGTITYPDVASVAPALIVHELTTVVGDARRPLLIGIPINHPITWLAALATVMLIGWLSLESIRPHRLNQNVAEVPIASSEPAAKNRPAAPPGQVVASIVESVGASLESPAGFFSVVPKDGFPGTTGSYRLIRGVIGIHYASGARLLVSAPAEFELISVDRIRLSLGRLSAHMPTEESKGFAVETPSATAIDYGTEFAVEVAAGLESSDEFHVFTGEVSVQPREPNQEWPISMTSGQAIRLDHETNTPAGIGLDPIRFIRRFQSPPSPYAAAVMRLKPAAYFKMEIDEEELQLRDSVDPQRTARIFSREREYIPWSAGIDGGSSLRLNGNISRAYAVAGEYPQTSDDQLTVAAWVYANSRPLWASIAKNWGEGADPNQRGQFHFGLKGTTGQLEAHLNDIDDIEKFAIETEPLPLNQWHHVAMVADGSRLRLYRNGKEVGSVAYTKIVGSPNLRTLSIGSKLDGSGSWIEPCNRGFWDGSIDELAIFNHALDRRDIAELHKIGRDLLSHVSP